MVENFKNRDLNVVVFKDGEYTVGMYQYVPKKHGWLNRMQISSVV